MFTRKCQKTPKIDENINIDWENLNIFWTTWETLMKFPGKSQKKQGFTLFEKMQIRKKLQMLSKFEVISEILFFSSKSIPSPLNVCLSSFLLFLNLKLQLMSKLEVKKNFPKFPSFDLGYRTKSKTRKSREFSFFLLKAYLDL